MLAWTVSRAGKDASALEGHPYVRLFRISPPEALIPTPVIILNSRGIFCLLMFLDLLIAYVLTLLFPEIWTLNHHFPSLSSRHFNKFSKWSRRFGYTLLSIIISSYILSVCLPSKQKSLYGTIATREMFVVFSSCIYLMHKCEFALGRSLSFRMTEFYELVQLWAQYLRASRELCCVWLRLQFTQ